MAVEQAADGVVLLEGFVVGAVMFMRFESVVVNKPKRQKKNSILKVYGIRKVN